MIKMARPFFRILQIATIVLFVWIFILIIGIFAPSTWNIGSLTHILGALKNIISNGLYFSLATITCGGGPSASYGVGTFFGSMNFNPPLYYDWFLNGLEPMVFQFLNQIFHITWNPSYYNLGPDVGLPVNYKSVQDMVNGYTDLPSGLEVPAIYNLFTGDLATMIENLYQLLFILFLVLAVIYFLMFLGKSDIKYSLLSTMATLAPLLLALFEILFFQLIQFIFSLFAGGGFDAASAFDSVENALPPINFVDETLLEKTLTWPVFMMAFFVYAFLELCFQTSYVGRVTQPSIQRTKRLERQLTIIGEQSLLLELEKEKQMRETGMRSTFTKKVEGERKITLKSFFTGDGISSIKEMLERREREKEKERLEEVSSDTRRLNRYTSRLFEVDNEAKHTLTAAGSAPSQKNMIASTLVNMGFRLLFLFGLTLVCANPILFFRVFNVPAIIEESVGFGAPEAIITVLVPIALLFPVISFLIRTAKRYQLTQIMKNREEESDFLRRLSELREIEAQEMLGED